AITGPASTAFTVVAAAPDHIGFGVQPAAASASAPITPAVTVKVFDRFGNVVLSDNTTQITLTVASAPGGFAPGSTTTVTAVGGVATFSNLVLNTTGTYTLGESGTGGLTGPNSGSFTVGSTTADHLAFGVQPSTTAAGALIAPALTVRVLDRFGNLVTTDNSN